MTAALVAALAAPALGILASVAIPARRAGAVLTSFLAPGLVAWGAVVAGGGATVGRFRAPPLVAAAAAGATLLGMAVARRRDLETVLPVGLAVGALGAGLTLGLASNFDRRLRRVLAGHPELAAAGHLAISSEIGWRKPGLEFFTALCTGIELPPEKVLLVGDDVINDYEGARNAGLEAILLDSEGEAHSAQRTCIQQLRELL